MTPDAVAAIVLSAGFSERMGEFKPLMILGETTILERVIRLFQSVGVDRIHVVLGHRAAEVVPLVEGWGARAIVNSSFAEGMFSSAVAGVLSLDSATEAFFLLPVDIPLVRPATLSDLLSAFPAGAAAVCHPTFRGRRGHPPLISGKHISCILDWRGDGGMAAVLARLERHAVEVAVVDRFIHQDLDRPEDFRRMAGRLPERKFFSPAECRALLKDRLRVAPSVVAHGRAVAATALRIGKAMNRSGCTLNLRLIQAAALVHDMARGEHDHARRGAELLQDLDMPLMADIVETHMDLTPVEGRPVDEAEVVFLADKLIREEHVVGLAERFRSRLDDSLAGSPAYEGARRRYESAVAIARRVEAVIGRSLDRL